MSDIDQASYRREAAALGRPWQGLTHSGMGKGLIAWEPRPNSWHGGTLTLQVVGAATLAAQIGDANLFCSWHPGIVARPHLACVTVYHVAVCHRHTSNSPNGAASSRTARGLGYPSEKLWRYRLTGHLSYARAVQTVASPGGTSCSSGSCDARPCGQRPRPQCPDGHGEVARLIGMTRGRGG